MSHKNGNVFKGITLEIANLYGIFTGEPMIGNNTLSLFPLKIGNNGKIISAPASLNNLMTHFGFDQPILERMRMCREAGKPLIDWEEHGLRDQRKEDFCRNYIDPIKREVEEISDSARFWFRCIPGEEVFHKNETTGELEYGFDAHRQVLTLLPKSAEETKKRYKREDKHIILLSRQIAYLVIWFCQHHLITRINDAYTMLGDWRPYLAEPYSEPWLKRLTEEKIRNAINQ